MTANPTTTPDGSRAITTQALSIIDSHHYPMNNTTEITTAAPLDPWTRPRQILDGIRLANCPGHGCYGHRPAAIRS